MTRGNTVLNTAFYRFITLDDLEGLRAKLRTLAQEFELLGTVILSKEGFNASVAGSEKNVDSFKTKVCELTGVDRDSLDFKDSWSAEQPFRRMLVRIKKEISPMGLDSIRPEEKTAERLPPTQLKEWLESERDFTLLDTRNDFEFRLGSFEKAEDLSLKHFRKFVHTMDHLPEAKKKEWKSKPMVLFCTGGIRCEKASAYLLEEGYPEVYQLEGGILNYFETVGSDHYRGECFVFDQRVTLDADLKEAATKQCFACRAVVTPEEQMSPDYVMGVSCPACASRRNSEKRPPKKEPHSQSRAQVPAGEKS